MIIDIHNDDFYDMARQYIKFSSEKDDTTNDVANSPEKVYEDEGHGDPSNIQGDYSYNVAV